MNTSQPHSTDPRAAVVLPLSSEETAAVRAFHKLYYDHWLKGSGTLSILWRGYSAIKCPLDLWIYQEIIHRRKPDLIVETGSAWGGSGLYLSDLCDIVGKGRVISIDTLNERHKAILPAHDRLTFLSGSSVDPAIVAQIYAAAREIGPEPEVMVILDSDHQAVHVLAEMQAYASLVRPGGYMIVEDSNVNGRPVRPNFGPGPGEAIIAFLQNDPNFEADAQCERFLMTCNPNGYLRRIPTNGRGGE